MHDANSIWDAMQLAAHRQGQKPHPIQHAHVAAYDPNENAVRVYFPHDTGSDHGWYPLLTPWVGQGWGMQIGPMTGGLDAGGNPTGEPCIVVFPDPEGQLGICLLGSFNNNNRAPGAPAGEAWLVHKSGSTIKLRNDGGAQITGAPVELGAAGVSGTAGNAVVRQSDLQAYHNNYVATHLHGTSMGPSTPPTVTTFTPSASTTVYAK